MRSGEAVRDQDRVRRATRLHVSYRKTGDPRQLKRARRLQRQVHRETMRRLTRALQPLGVAFARAAAGIGQATARMGDLWRAERAATDRRLAAEAAAISYMMRENPGLSAADAQRVYRAGAAQLMSRPIRASELAPGRLP